MEGKEGRFPSGSGCALGQLDSSNSAGASPKPAPHPLALEILREDFKIDASDAYSKSSGRVQRRTVRFRHHPVITPGIRPTDAPGFIVDSLRDGSRWKTNRPFESSNLPGALPSGPSDALSPRFKLPKAWAQRRFPSMGALIADSRVRAQPPLILPYATRRQCHVVLDFKNYAHARCFQHFRRSCSRCFRRQGD